MFTMSEEKSNKSKESDKSKKEHPFVDKFDKKQSHPLFRTEEESSKFIFNKLPLRHDEYPTNEQQSALQGSQPN